jgi:hypothetical protein
MVEIRNAINVLARNFKGNRPQVRPRIGKIEE